jgi:hypothetical protein
MLFRNIILASTVTLFISDIASAQEVPQKKDSTIIYKNIETYSKRHKFTKFMYSLVFKPAAIKPKKKAAPEKTIQHF